MILGSGVITIPAEFSVSLLLVAIIAHVGLSLLLATIIASIFHRFGTLVGVMGGALVGLAYYLINICMVVSDCLRAISQSNALMQILVS